MIFQNNKILNVTDISSYLYCPRKFYLKKVKGLKDPPTKPMIEGRIRHEVLEKFSKNEQNLLENFTQPLTKDQIITQFQNLLNNHIEIIFEKDSILIKQFSISPRELYQKIQIQMKNDIQLRAQTIENTMKKGFLGKDLFKNLTPKYISEMPLYSETLGLKGRADRVALDREKQTIIPFELKTRPIEKVWPSDEIQLTAYAMLLEEKYQTKIPFGILESGDVKHEVLITEQNKEKIRNIIEQIKKLLLNENADPMFPSSFSKCQTCSFKQECEDLNQ